MIRLTNEQWERIRNHFPEEHIPDGRPGRKPIPTRRVFEAVPPAKDEVRDICAAKLELYGRYLVVEDDGTCGGVKVLKPLGKL
jgi:hypothetical protein